MLFLTFIRLAISLVILKYPLWGGLIAIGVDFFDLNLFYVLDPGSLKHYQRWDKLLDITYLTIEAYIAFTWKNKLVSRTALVLYTYRLIGVFAFEIFQQKALLVAFPNIFELFFLSYLLQLYIFKKDRFKSIKTIGIVILFLTLFKISHEYLLHINNPKHWSKNEIIQKVIDPDFIPDIKPPDIIP